MKNNGKVTIKDKYFNINRIEIFCKILYNI